MSKKGVATACDKPNRTNTGSRAKGSLLLDRLQSPEIAQTLAELRARYGKYALPDAKLRKLMDKAMGDKTLTEELYAMREGK